MPDGWAGVTVEHESADPASTLAQYRRMLALRHRHPAFDETDVEVEVLEDVLVVRRGSVACVVNFAAEPRTSPVDGVRLVTSDPGVDATWPILPPASGAWVESAPA